MSEPEVALVLSPERWVEDLHRHCADHGGVRVRQLLMDPTLALEDDYGVLVVSHRWPGLTKALVDDLHATGRRVLGVVDPAEPAAAPHLATLGVDHVVASDVPVPDIVAAIQKLAPRLPVTAPARSEPRVSRRRATLVVVGGPTGSGATEVALGLSRVCAGARRNAVLVDADEHAPAIAIRLGLPIEPNLRTAVDAVEHGIGALRGAVARVDGLDVVAGLPNRAAWSQVRGAEVVRVVESLGAASAVVVANVGELSESGGAARPEPTVGRALVDEASTIVAVGGADPVAVVRLLEWVAQVRRLRRDARIHLTVNRAPRDAYRRAELAAELSCVLAPASLEFVPADRRVEAAAWAGVPVTHGPFTKAVARMTEATGIT